jgi:SagB-type dehydrogenase family enzyme
MDSDAAHAMLEYHEATKHSFDSVYRRPHHLDWDVMPRPFKVYPDLDALPLPHDFTSSTRPALAAVADPGSARGMGPTLDRRLLAHLLYFTAGVLRRRAFPGGEVFFRAAACTGALHHVDLYLACADLPDLDAGVYHFGPHDFALRRLRRGDHRGALVDATAGEPSVAAAPVVVVCATTFWRNSWKYRDRAYRHVFWDGGTLLANLLALAAAHGLPARIVHGFLDRPVDELLGLDRGREASFALVALGAGASAAAAPPLVEALGLETLPLSSREVDYPVIRAAHAASSFATPGEVAAWRSTPPRPTPELPAPSLRLLPADPERASQEPIETVVLRRGSARTFADEPIELGELATLLWCSTRGIPTDRSGVGGALATPYLIVRAVRDLPPGAYAYDRRQHGLVALRTGEFARDAGHLALGQSLAAEAAVNVYWLADLEAATGALGARGYRAVSLEAAIEGGKAYLAAYAQRLGATGLTFFDDDVTHFFSPLAARESVMFLVACGRTRPSAARRR